MVSAVQITWKTNKAPYTYGGGHDSYNHILQPKLQQIDATYSMHFGIALLYESTIYTLSCRVGVQKCKGGAEMKE
eukprot:246852-Pelagomonas_calceolata.AAC.1